MSWYKEKEQIVNIQDIILKHIEKENELIDRRINWMLVFQGFLIAGIATCLGGTNGEPSYFFGCFSLVIVVFNIIYINKVTNTIEAAEKGIGFHRLWWDAYKNEASFINKIKCRNNIGGKYPKYINKDKKTIEQWLKEICKKLNEKKEIGIFQTIEATPIDSVHKNHRFKQEDYGPYEPEIIGYDFSFYQKNKRNFLIEILNDNEKNKGKFYLIGKMFIFFWSIVVLLFVCYFAYKLSKVTKKSDTVSVSPKTGQVFKVELFSGIVERKAQKGTGNNDTEQAAFYGGI